ncbi:MAG: CopG family transcriptional regulator [Anaerolineae bacterium]|nr:MAG: CopG family transcriptional regulator [Anaerolineae bacterium]
MADTEKITINMSPVDLGNIDLLVEQGFYATRTDFIRTAIRNQIDSHGQAIREAVQRRSIVAGVLVYDKGDLEEKRYRNEKISVRVLGMFILEDDVTPELAAAVFTEIKIFGVFKASDAVKEALKDITS